MKKQNEQCYVLLRFEQIEGLYNNNETTRVIEVFYSRRLAKLYKRELTEAVGRLNLANKVSFSIIERNFI